MTRYFKSAVIAVVVVCAAFGTGCATDKQVIRQADGIHSEIDPAIITDPELTSYMTAIGRRVQSIAKEMSLAGEAPRKHKSGDTSWMFSDEVKFHIVNSKTINAFTTGGKHAYMYTELLRISRSEDEFAAVVAHEFAHIYCRHVHKGMERQYTSLGLAIAAGAAGYAAGGDNREEWAAGAFGVALVGGQFMGMGFGRDDEAEADKYGFRFYTRAGWDPNKFGDFFQQMIDKGYDKTPEMMSSHPSLKSRVEAARKRASELPPQARSWRRPNVATPEQFRRLQERAVAVGRSMPNDQSLQAAQLRLALFPSCVAPIAQPEQRAAKEQLIEAEKNRSGK